MELNADASMEQGEPCKVILRSRVCYPRGAPCPELQPVNPAIAPKAAYLRMMNPATHLLSTGKYLTDKDFVFWVSFGLQCYAKFGHCLVS
jgi:hypothetical protein